MKKLTIMLLALGLSSLLTAANDCGKCPMPCGQKDSTEMKSMDMKGMDMKKDAAQTEAEKLIYYTCPMPSHSDVHSAEAGKCPKCGMELVKAVVTDAEHASFYGCPMPSHSHIRHDKPGKCEECGMTLEPMRLVK